MQRLRDQQGRNFQYLRLSITDVCNFKCQYCLPHGYQKKEHAEEPLRIDEIRRLVQAFSEMGFWKVRITGGEPTLRSDLLEIIGTLAALPSVQYLALTTNGTRLAQLAPRLKEAGLNGLNVSVDHLDRKTFSRITGMDRLPEILHGVYESLRVGFSSVKVNVVLMKGVNDETLSDFLSWIRNLPISVRFIQLMETGHQNRFFQDYHLTAGQIQLELLRAGWKQKERKTGDGPAIEFTHPDSLGQIGIIAPYSEGFCQNCNRLRVSSTGQLQLCLFGEKGYGLRHLLQRDDQKEELSALISQLIQEKKPSHFLHEGNYGQMQTFSSIGG